MKKKILFYFGHLLLISWFVGYKIFGMDGIVHLLLVSGLITYFIALTKKGFGLIENGHPIIGRSEMDQEYPDRYFARPVPAALRNFEPGPTYVFVISNSDSDPHVAVISARNINAENFGSHKSITIYPGYTNLSFETLLKLIEQESVNIIKIQTYANGAQDGLSPWYHYYSNNVESKVGMDPDNFSRMPQGNTPGVEYKLNKDSGISLLILPKETVVMRIYTEK